jgi:hypothetical protein
MKGTQTAGKAPSPQMRTSNTSRQYISSISMQIHNSEFFKGLDVLGRGE